MARRRRAPVQRVKVGGEKLTQLEADFLAVWERFAPDAPRPVCQYPYAAEIGRRFRADFAWPEAKVLVECEGGVTTRQAHGSISGILRDIERANAAAACGWRVFRVWRGMLDDWGQAEAFVRLLNHAIDLQYLQVSAP